MQGINIIERAFQLAGTCGSLDEVRDALKREGYSQVEAHFDGARIKADIRARLNPDEVKRKVAARRGG